MRVEAVPMEGNLKGMSMAMALAASLVSCLTGCRTVRDIGVSASLDISGRLWAVEGLGPKSAAMKQVGLKRILYPPRSSVWDELSGLEPVLCSDAMEAISHLIEPHPQPQPDAAAEPQPALDVSRHERGLVGVSQSLAVTIGSTDYLGQPIAADAKGSIDTVEGELQVVECYVLTGPGESKVEVLGQKEENMHDLAIHSTDYVFTLLEAGTLRPSALPAWPLPAGHHFRVHFNFPPCDNSDLCASMQACMTLALIGAVTGRAPIPGVVVVGEHTQDGLLMPVVSASVADLRIMEATEGLRKLVIVHQAAIKLKSLTRREATPRLREMEIEIVGAETIHDVIDLAFEPDVQEA